MDPAAGLPPAAELRRKAGRGETFSRLKDWVRGLSRQEQGVKRAGRCLRLEDRHAVLHFLWEESQAGVRQRRAKELLKLLEEVQEFAGGIKLEQEWEFEDKLDCKAPEGAARCPAAPDPQQGPPDNSGLPSSAELEDPQADGKDVFQRLRAWVRAQRQAGHLEAAAAGLGANYRRCVFEFLAAFCRKRTVFRAQAWEMLQRLSSQAAWRQGGAGDGAAVAGALADPPSGVVVPVGARGAAEDWTGSSEATSRASSLDAPCERSALPNELLVVPCVC